MKFHSLMAALLLPLLLLPTSGSGATPVSSSTEVAAAPAASTEADAWVYQNGDLVLDLRDTAGAEVLRASLDYFFHDDHIATANEAPAAPSGAIDAAPALPAGADDAAAEAPLPEPLPLGLLGAGIVVLGWTRRQGGRLSGSSARSELVRTMWPWPSLPWLD